MQLVFTLVRQLHGTIDVRSEPGVGTSFELSLQEISVQDNEYAQL
jgi:signal transduction histidine kinase